MSNGFDVAAFIPKFVDESKDRIQRLNKAVLAFEKNSSDSELLKDILREVHTLKGTARMMGFSDIVALSHKIEDVFVRVKESGLRTTKELCDVIFHALDVLENMVEMKLNDPAATTNGEEACGRIESVLNSTWAQSAGGKPSEAVSAGIRTEDSVQGKKPQISARNVSGKPALSVPPDYQAQEDFVKAAGLQEDKKTIRIGLDKVESLYNHFVELIMVQMAFHQRCGELEKLNHDAKRLMSLKAASDCDGSTQGSERKKLHKDFTGSDATDKELLNGISRFFEAYASDIVKLDAVTEDIRRQVMSMRMQPISAAFDLAPRLVRDLSGQFSKEVYLEISGSEVELDNTIIEMLKDPLVHLLRNAIDHGIEEPTVRVSLGKKKPGMISLRAKQEGGDVFVTIEDDGKGIDKEAVKETAARKGLLNIDEAKELSDEEVYGLIMKPGFTTSRIITDTSGRGIGMDVIKTIVGRLNGSLIVESKKGKGTKFILKVPATIALVNVLFIRVENKIFAIPATIIERIAYISWKDVKTLEGKASVFIEGQTIPLVRIADALRLEKGEKKDSESIPLIVSRSDGKKVGFVVSEFLYEEEVVFREFRGYLKRPGCFSGITTSGTGEVILILNVQELVQAKDSLNEFTSAEVPKVKTASAKKYAILIAEDSMITAELEKNILVNAGYEVDIAVDGIDAMDKLYGKKYDVLVTDVDMPKMNGFELTAKVKEDIRLKELPVIVVTAREKTEDKRRGIEVGADAYILKKEFDQSNLLVTIKRLIGE